MPVTSFKFVSPGVFVNEIDNSYTPQEADAIGPVVIGRSTRGLAMQPIKVQSYSEFVEMFGDTVPGNGGGDVYRNGNYQAPMYGTYAAKAFLNANVAPLTYVRLLGQETSVGSAAGGSTPAAAAGWKTDNVALSNGASAGGAYGLFIAPSSSNGEFTGSFAMELAAVIYVQSGSVQLSGTLAGPVTTNVVKASSTLVESDASGDFKLVINGPTSSDFKIFTVNLDDDNKNYIRKALNTNPQLASAAGAFYPTSSFEDYWLGESFEQEIRDMNLGNTTVIGMIAGIGSGSTGTTGPHNMKSVPSQEAIAGWFVGQDLGTAINYNPANAKKLFRLIGRGHGEWLSKNCKVSIANLRQSNTTTDEYGTFSVLIRSITDTDVNEEILERFDNCTLDPTSPNYIAKLIGDRYERWDSTSRTLKSYGDFPNLSRYIRIEMNDDVEAGATDPVLLPFGYQGPPVPANAVGIAANASTVQDSKMITLGTGLPGYTDTSGATLDISSSWGIAATASLNFPSVRLLNDAQDVDTNQTKAYFGMQTMREATGNKVQKGISDVHRLWYAGMGASSGIPTIPTADVLSEFAYIFTMDNVSGSAPYTYLSGSRTAGTSYSAVNGYEALLNADINRFTAPFWGGFDGFDITKPDPVYNGAMTSTSTEDDNYVYHTYTRAIETVSDPDYINMNLLAIPGLTNTSLTSMMIEKCEERGDALALIDLPDVYKPSHEEYLADKTQRIGTTPVQSANSLKTRRIDSSYGATFYPWVQTVDANTSQILWVPPTVAMMGVLASSEASSAVWFAPAGFNRGGLTDGAAGIPISGVSERLSSKDRDTLYDARINPIASFPSEGIVVFGQKTLQERPSALDRINVRRLVIFLKKQISILSTQVLFEQNVQGTWNNFKALINPLLANTRSGGGITNYKLILDSSTTTSDLIDQNILYAKIMVKPARAIEYIAIDFVIASSGASFDD